MWAHQSVDVTPDIMTVAKPLANGTALTSLSFFRVALGA